MSKQSSGDGSKNISYGETIQKRAWELVEALIDGANSLDTGTKALRVLKWIERSNNLKVVTNMVELRYLVKDIKIFKPTIKTTEKGVTDFINYVLIYCLGEKFLGILHDERGLMKGAEEWNFTLSLWSQDRAKNKEAFDQLWLEKKQARSRQKPSLSVTVKTETVTEVSVVNLPGETDQSTTKPAASTPATDKKVALHEAIPAVPVWKGRDELLNDLKTKLLQPENTPKVLALIGQGGIGKTSLAVKLLEALGVNLSSCTVTTDCPYQCAMYFKADVGTSFDEVADFLLIDGLDFETAEPLKTADEKIAKIIAGLTETRCMLVLDNLESILQKAGDPQPGRATSQDWGKLINALVYQQHQSQIILTSREVPADLGDPRSKKSRINSKLVYIERLTGVDTKAGIEILQAYNFQDKLEDLEWISERVKGHLFVLTLLSEYAEQPGYLRKRPELVTEEVEPILREQLEKHSEAAQDLLRRMCILRVGIDRRGLTFLRLYTNEWEQDNRLMVAANENKAVEFTEAEISETEALVERLVNCSLVESQFDRDKCEILYKLHQVIAEFMRQDYEQLPRLFKRVDLFYRSTITFNDIKDMSDLQRFGEASIFALNVGDEREQLRLGEIILNYSFRLGNGNLIENLLMQHHSIVEANNQAGTLLWFGSSHYKIGNWEEAKRCFESALATAQAEGKREEVATAIEWLGCIERERGNWEEAQRLYRQSLEVQTELGDRSGMASSWGQLGYIELLRGNWEEAERLYRQCLEVETELGERSGMATSWGLLGDIERMRGNFDAAEQLKRQSFQLREELGDRSGMAKAIGSLGEVELGRGNLDVAEQFLTDALERFKELGESWFIAEASFRLAQVWQKRNNTELAQQHYNTAHQIYQQLGAAKNLERIEREWESD